MPTLTHTQRATDALARRIADGLDTLDPTEFVIQNYTFDICDGDGISERLVAVVDDGCLIDAEYIYLWQTIDAEGDRVTHRKSITITPADTDVWSYLMRMTEATESI